MALCIQCERWSRLRNDMGGKWCNKSRRHVWQNTKACDKAVIYIKKQRHVGGAQ